ncbi:hypothetical protein AURDEDRAFT_172564 [Auricularia subglabra TFB-10046 SS5]|nr:hypothetical protein AURDEDRAFT_172564 [Auricularia subglabra TFB-10046 SS5]
MRMLKQYLFTTVEAIRRQGHVILPEHVADARRYLQSDEVRQFCTPTTAVFPKPIATQNDLLFLLIEFWCSPAIHTTRMRVQLSFGTVLVAVLGDRPGGIWESTCYVGTNQALKYGDLEVFIMCNPQDPNGPGIPLMRVTNNLLKGMRNDDSKYKTVVLYAEPDQDRIFCAVHLLLALALEDGAFADVQTIQEALDVSKYQNHLRCLAWLPQWEQRPVMRQKVLTPEHGWAKIEAMSHVILPGAPRVLTAQQRAEIDADEEIVACDHGYQQAHAKAAEYKAELCRLADLPVGNDQVVDRDDLVEQLQQQLKAALAEAHLHKNKRNRLYAAEKRAVLKDFRNQIFEDVTSGRRLPSEMDIIGPQSHITVPDARKALMDELYAHPLDRYLAIAASVGGSHGLQLIEAVEAILALSASVSGPKLLQYSWTLWPSWPHFWA